ncbi:hypothetical protein BDR26DRAFT_1007824 [Obelidium mucronatum]|nr:hypothetical protein BDR26DRAFT_1007824 [Obelidium mucronatum]
MSVPLLLETLPYELKMHIFLFIHFDSVFKYTRLSRAFQDMLLTKQFIITNRLIHNDLYSPSNYWSFYRTNIKVLSFSVESAQGYVKTRLSHRPNSHQFHLKNCPKKQLPSTINLIPCLTTIDLHEFRLRGTLPAALFDCVNLKSLYLGLNRLTGPIPKEIGNLVNLKRLMIFQNGLTGSIPPEFGKLVNLEYCNMEKNDLEGDIPPEIGGLVSVIALRIHVQNNAILKYPPEVSKLKNLVSCGYGDGYDVCRPFLPENLWIQGFTIPRDEEDSDEEEGDSDTTGGWEIAILVAAVAVVNAQYDPNGPTQVGPNGAYTLPKGCVGSFPNITQCLISNWWLGENPVDPCAPPKPWPVAGQLAYIKDEQNFCLLLPDPDSIVLQNNYYSWGKYPTIVQAEGYVRSFCMGSYLPPGSLPLPWGGIRSAHVVKNYTKPGNHYLQVHGYLDCDLLKINCTESFPGAFDDGGQYDNVKFLNCGKEPYSGVDPSAAGNGHIDYVEQAGNGQFCMRTCEAHVPGGDWNCPADKDTVGCFGTMGVVFKDGFTYTDLATGQVTTASVSLPPLPTKTAVASATGKATGVATVTKTGGAAAASFPSVVLSLMVLVVGASML